MAESSADFGGGVSYSHTQVAQSSNFDRLSEGSGATEDGDAEVDYTMKVGRQLSFFLKFFENHRAFYCEKYKKSIVRLTNVIATKIDKNSCHD